VYDGQYSPTDSLLLAYEARHFLAEAFAYALMSIAHA